MGHVPALFKDLILRLRLTKDASSRIITGASVAHGQRRLEQGYSAAQLVEASRVFQAATFRTLHLCRSELDHDQVLLDVMVIADEVDAQLAEAVGSLTGTKPAQPTAKLHLGILPPNRFEFVGCPQFSVPMRLRA